MPRLRRAAGADAGTLLLLLGIGLFWGLNWPAVRIGLTELQPFTLRSVGFVAGGGILALIARLRGEALMPRREELPRLVLAGLLSVMGFNVLTAFGQLATETSRAAILAFTMPLWATLMATAMGERLTGERIVALLAGMAGLMLLLGPDLLVAGGSPLGSLLVLGAAVSWAAGTLVLKSRTWSLGPVALAAWLIGVSTPPVLLGSALLEQPWQLGWPSPPVVGAMLYHIALPMVFCHAAWVTLVGRLPAPVAAIGTLLIPVVGVISAVLLLGEPLGARKLAALLLVTGAVATVLVGPALRRGPGS
ncbi:DMT family transporter [Rhodospirillales bacterium YIM 152171]|uniref:DMT family transporter n=2 Tax=Marinimicrococcus flavescens TaxID=3031815 RepID=A0AAP3XQQ9_9PROT|nr:DMT family transporter [Marinimicrococcus flavescens]